MLSEAPFVAATSVLLPFEGFGPFDIVVSEFAMFTLRLGTLRSCGGLLALQMAVILVEVVTRSAAPEMIIDALSRPKRCPVRGWIQ